MARGKAGLSRPPFRRAHRFKLHFFPSVFLPSFSLPPFPFSPCYGASAAAITASESDLWLRCTPLMGRGREGVTQVSFLITKMDRR